MVLAAIWAALALVTALEAIVDVAEPGPVAVTSPVRAVMDALRLVGVQFVPSNSKTCPLVGAVATMFTVLIALDVLAVVAVAALSALILVITPVPSMVIFPVVAFMTPA